MQDTSTSQLYALKKIRCPFGQESVSLALKEVEAYTLFSPHPNIIASVDYSVESARDRSDPGSKTVYILLPYYRRGNLQDAINANLVNHSRFPERRLMILFLGVARALKAMHQYKVKGAPGGPDAQEKAKNVRKNASEADRDASRKAKHRRRNEETEQNGEDVEQEPLIDNEVTKSQEGFGEGEIRAYAHRDIKPGAESSSTFWHFASKLTFLKRQHYDCRRRLHANSHGSRLACPVSYPDYISISRHRRPRYRRRTLHHALSRPRAL